MAPEPPKSAMASKEELDVISNRIAVALAKRESLIKSWTSSHLGERPAEDPQAELDAEAALFRSQPPYLGVGAPIPAQFLVSEGERNNKALRAKFFTSKELKASKARDAEEKASSAKRGLRVDSSDEEEGRSGLGRAKKQKAKMKVEPRINKMATGDSEEDGRPSVSRPKLVKPSAPMKKDSTQIKKPIIGGSSSSSINSPLQLVEKEKDEPQELHGIHDKPSDLDKSKSGIMDAMELKRMKKREKRKRQKLKAAEKALEA